MTPSQIRKCKECGETFATPNALMGHKRPGGGCRPVDVLVSRGFQPSAKGWVFKPK